MKKLLLITLLFSSLASFGQFTKPQLYSNINTNIRKSPYSPAKTAAVLDSIVKTMNTSAYYQTIQNSGSDLTQRAKLNFTGGLVASDNSPVTNVRLGSGTLGGDTYIEGNYVFAMGASTPLAQFVFNAKAASTNYLTAGTSSVQSGIEITDASIQNYKTSDGGTTRIATYLQTNGFTILDQIGSFGALYSADYSTNGILNLRWIPDWGAVNSATATLTNKTWNGGVIGVVYGGTGRATSTTAYGLLAAGTTATGAHQTLSAGATTTILVGGGASALPVWTTATGSGAPVRATSPTLVTPALGTPTALVLTSATGLPPTTGIVGWPANASGVLTNNGSGTLTWGAGSSSTLNSITAATAGNTIDNTNYAQQWQWSTLATGNGLSLTTTSTIIDHTLGTGGLLSVNGSGVNSTSLKRSIGVSSVILNTGTTSRNVAYYAKAQGGANNYALWVDDGDIYFNQSISSIIAVSTLRLQTGGGIIRTQIGVTGFQSHMAGPYTSGNNTSFMWTVQASTNQTANTEETAWLFDGSATTQFATSASFAAAQRMIKILAPTYGFVGASTMPLAATMSIGGAPKGGTNATITNSIGLNVETATLTNTTNGYGAVFNAPSGATNNHAIGISGTVTSSSGFVTFANIAHTTAATHSWLSLDFFTANQARIYTADGIPGATTGNNFILQAGSGWSTGNTDAGSISLTTGTPFGSGVEGAVNVQTRSGGKVGFYGASAIARPTTAISAATFVANTSLIANDSATWGGYTLGQIVMALLSLGLLQ